MEDAVIRLLEAVDKAGAEGVPRPSTIRLTLQPAPDPQSAADVMDELGEVSEGNDVLINVGFYSMINAGHIAREAVLNGLYLSVLLDTTRWDAIRGLVRLINAIAEEDVDASTRIAVNTGGRPLRTPFYPISSTLEGEEALTIGLTYPSYLLEAYRRGGIEALRNAIIEAARFAERNVEAIARELTLRDYGVDLSVAPWMEDSTLGLVEAIAGVRLPEPGIAMGVAIVNKYIREVASELGRTTGFNEVQLPVGEDSKLKARASEGETRARDLARLAGLCVAGLDMVVIPYDERLVGGLILEVAAYSLVKERVLGVRVIPLEGVEPGDKVSFKRFGEIPAIPI